jgi:pSer/pThr/pTyr-binding forkhead associated (FHA) protein
MRPALGELVPLGGGDAIPLLRTTMKVGRRRSCDIALPFANVSSIHCELAYKDGYWVVRDLDSTNGIKVNGQRLRFRPLRPGDKITIGRREYQINYELPQHGQTALESLLSESEDIYSQSLMEKAGLTRSKNPVFDDDDEEDDGTMDDDD